MTPCIDDTPCINMRSLRTLRARTEVVRFHNPVNAAYPHGRHLGSLFTPTRARAGVYLSAPISSQASLQPAGTGDILPVAYRPYSHMACE